MGERRGVVVSRATFAAGCFWGVESAFRAARGVLSVTVGYAGGATVEPTYREVCAGRTGHAECVEVVFDRSMVGYAELLDVFWRAHDPTTLNRQGPDVGTQYRSAIFVHDEEQAAVARASRAAEERSGRHRRPIVTEITPAPAFYPAEEYHQRFLEKRALGTRKPGSP